MFTLSSRGSPWVSKFDTWSALGWADTDDKATRISDFDSFLV